MKCSRLATSAIGGLRFSECARLWRPYGVAPSVVSAVVARALLGTLLAWWSSFEQARVPRALRGLTSTPPEVQGLSERTCK